MSSLVLTLTSAALVTVLFMPILFLFWLIRPTVLPNPGMSAYKPHSATRLEPLARRIESVETDEPSDLVVLSNLARNYARPYPSSDDDDRRNEIANTAKRQAHVSADKRPRSAKARHRHELSYAYALDWKAVKP